MNTIPNIPNVDKPLKLHPYTKYVNAEYAWLRRQLSAITHLIQGLIVHNPSDPWWHEKTTQSQLCWTIQELGRFYRSWQGRTMEPLNKLILGFSPIFFDVRHADKNGTKRKYFNLLEQILLAKTIGILNDSTDLAAFSTLALEHLAKIDPVTARIQSIIDRQFLFNKNPTMKTHCTLAQTIGDDLEGRIEALYLQLIGKDFFHLPPRPYPQRNDCLFLGSLLSAPPPAHWIPTQSEMDFWTLDTLHVAHDDKEPCETAHEVSLQEGYNFTTDKVESRWPRDIRLQLGRKSLYPCQPHPSNKWYKNYESWVLKDGHSCVSKHSHPSFPNGLFADYSELSNEQLFDLQFLEESRELHCYFEGGNLLRSISPKGKRIYIHGAHNVIATWMIHREIYARPQLYTKPWHNHLRKKRAHKINKLRKEKKGSSLFSKEEILRLRNSHFIRTSKKHQAEECRKIYAELHIARETLQEDFKGKQIILMDQGGLRLPQIDFHIDMNIASLPGMRVFIQDHIESARVLKLLLMVGSLTLEERELFEDYLKSAEHLAQLEGPLVDEAEAQLKKEGFSVLRVPARYFSGKTPHINYINYINGLYYLGKDKNIVAEVMGYPQAGEHYLRDAYIRYLKHFGVERIYFHGRRVSTPSVSSDGSLPYTNALQRVFNNGAWHCSTNEICLGDIQQQPTSKTSN